MKKMNAYRFISTTILIIALILSIIFSVSSQEQKQNGFKADILKDLATAEKKLVDLAGAMGTNKYTWRPGEGVRSVSEVYMHIAGTNYWFPTMLGYQAPSNVKITKDYETAAALEKITDKEKVVTILKESFNHLRNVINKIPDSKINENINFFGSSSSIQAVLLMMTSHIHEHLGQSVAYARVNGVVPPWSR